MLALILFQVRVLTRCELARWSAYNFYQIVQSIVFSILEVVNNKKRGDDDKNDDEHRQKKIALSFLALQIVAYYVYVFFMLQLIEFPWTAGTFWSWLLGKH